MTPASQPHTIDVGLEWTMVLITTQPGSLELGSRGDELLSNIDHSQNLDSSHDRYIASNLYGNQSNSKK